MAYTSWSHVDRGQLNTVNFTNELMNKYRLNTLVGEPNRPFEWYLNLTAHATFAVNLETWYFVGNQGVQSAILGTIQFGGVSDSNFLLYPDFATNNIEILTEHFDDVYNNMDRRIEVIKYAHQKARELYSFDYFKKQINYILSEI